ncbi:ATP-binding cassette domain-containing protein [Demequina pelophila]|uniref:ATP-binding cassette domain-containing protein n=1 Tax=Demequina pelophila TaxID=1638984 RepID=UPI000780EA80|nr:ATP-binding cassette domain-containing protein [Demequina pelophila]
MTAPVLEVRGLEVALGHRRARRTVLHDVSFVIEPGATLGLVGESGSGKTTTGRAIAGLVRPASGSILLDGHDVSRERWWRRPGGGTLQVVFQDPYSSMNPALRVEDILREPLRTLRLPRAEARRRSEEMLARVGLPVAALDRYVAAFSGGQRQRLAIARALVSRPRVIVCDEAVSALDLSVQAQVLNLLKDLQEELGIAYLFIGHNLDVVEFMSHRIAVLYEGRVVESGDAAEVLRRPTHAYTRRLVSAILSPDPREQARRRALVTATPTQEGPS